MRGTMMDFPLTLRHIFERGTRLFPNREIVTGGATGAHRHTYAEFGERVHRLASALQRLGLEPGQRVGSFAWNHYRHLELYFAVPHERWAERPMACVVPRPEAKDNLTPEELTEYLAQQFAKWWLPDQYLFLAELPKTSVGKFDKKAMRQQFAPAETGASA
jgi:acyl-CoA synthetase (AMP-forming)/AMP-acid ligase II